MQVFVDQWVYHSGCASFTGSFIFNRKRNVVELELKQETSGKGILKYVVGSHSQGSAAQLHTSYWCVSENIMPVNVLIWVSFFKLAYRFYTP